MQITHDLAIGGLQRVVTTLCETIDRRAFDVQVLCLRALGPFSTEIENMGLRVTLLPQTGRTDYMSFAKVARILRAERIDVIHTHNTQPFVDGTLGALLAGVETVVHTDHGRMFPDKKRYMLAERMVSRFAYRVVGVSDDTARKLIHYEKIHPEKVLTIANGIDGARFTAPVDRAAARADLGLDADSLVIGVAARLSVEKGIAYLLEALPRVVSCFPAVVLLIAGEGPLEAELRRMAKALGVDHHVRFLGPRTDIPLLLSLFDVYALPSLSEGLPMILLEAMAAGCPILATAVGGIPSAVQSEVNGLLVPPQDPASLAAALTRVLASPELRHRLADQARGSFRARFSAEAMARQYERLYRRQAYPACRHRSLT